MNHLVERIQRLPLDLRLFCIIPYTYELQPPKLVHDIRTYRVDTRILDNVYGTMYNDAILRIRFGLPSKMLRRVETTFFIQTHVKLAIV